MMKIKWKKIINRQTGRLSWREQGQLYNAAQKDRRRRNIMTTELRKSCASLLPPNGESQKLRPLRLNASLMALTYVHVFKEFLH